MFFKYDKLGVNFEKLRVRKQLISLMTSRKNKFQLKIERKLIKKLAKLQNIQFVMV